jgi:hypothetical protein
MNTEGWEGGEWVRFEKKKLHQNTIGDPPSYFCAAQRAPTQALPKMDPNELLCIYTQAGHIIKCAQKGRRIREGG